MREVNLQNEIIITADSVHVVKTKTTHSTECNPAKNCGRDCKIMHPANAVSIERIGPGLFEHPYSEFMNSRL